MSNDQATPSPSRSAPESPVLNVSQTFHLEEYKALRGEIVAETTKYTQMKFILLAALGAVYSWTFINLTGTEGGRMCLELQLTPLLFVLLIPVFIALMVLLEAYYQLFHLRQLECYLGKVEKYLGDGSLGWHQLRLRRHRIGLFWMVLILACAAVSFGFYGYAVYEEITTCGAGTDQLDIASINRLSRDIWQAPDSAEVDGRL